VVKFTVRGDVLLEAMRAVRHAAADTYARPILASICFDIEAERARVVAADNYRIAIQGFDMYGFDVLEPGVFVMPVADYPLVTAFLHAHRALPITAEEEDLYVRFALMHGQPLREGASVRVRCLDGDFPKYEEALAEQLAKPRRTFVMDAKFLPLWHSRSPGQAGSVLVGVADGDEPSAVTFERDHYREIVMPLKVAWPAGGPTPP
jgi:hypothetical protein